MGIGGGGEGTCCCHIGGSMDDRWDRFILVEEELAGAPRSLKTTRDVEFFFFSFEM